MRVDDALLRPKPFDMQIGEAARNTACTECECDHYESITY